MPKRSRYRWRNVRSKIYIYTLECPVCRVVESGKSRIFHIRNTAEQLTVRNFNILELGSVYILERNSLIFHKQKVWQLMGNGEYWLISLPFFIFLCPLPSLQRELIQHGVQLTIQEIIMFVFEANSACFFFTLLPYACIYFCLLFIIQILLFFKLFFKVKSFFIEVVWLQQE